MELKGEARLLRIFFGEADKLGPTPLHEAIVRKVQIVKYISGKSAAHPAAKPT